MGFVWFAMWSVSSLHPSTVSILLQSWLQKFNIMWFITNYLFLNLLAINLSSSPSLHSGDISLCMSSHLLLHALQCFLSGLLCLLTSLLMSPFACPHAGLYLPPAPCHLFKSHSVIPHITSRLPPVTFVHSSWLCFLNTLGQRCHKELTSCSFGVQWVVMLMASSHSAHALQLQFPRACQLSSSLFGFFFPLQGKYAFGFWLTTCWAVLHHWCKQKKSYYWRWRSLPLEAHVFVSLCGNICFPMFPLQWKVFKQIKYMRDRKFTFTFTYL